MTDQDQAKFSGFEDDLKLIRLPETFFTKLMPEMEDLSQVRLLLYMFWHLEQQQSNNRYFRIEELMDDRTLTEMVGGEEALKKALEKLIESGIVLAAELPWLNEVYYFINGPQGRAAVETIQRGEWKHEPHNRLPIQLPEAHPNIFKLYEENIGPITPMIAEVLKADEETYPQTWIEEAIRIAVTRNARNWKYVQAILHRWQKEGRGNEQDRRDDSQDPGSYRESWLGKKSSNG